MASADSALRRGAIRAADCAAGGAAPAAGVASAPALEVEDDDAGAYAGADGATRAIAGALTVAGAFTVPGAFTVASAFTVAGVLAAGKGAGPLAGARSSFASGGTTASAPGDSGGKARNAAAG